MEKLVALLFRLFFICCFLLVDSCSNDHADDMVFYALDNESRQWLYAGVERDGFTLVDSVSIQQILSLYKERTYYKERKKSSGIFGMQDIVYAEYEAIKQLFSSNGGLTFSLELTATELPGNTELEIEINNTLVMIDPIARKINEVLVWKQIDENSRNGKSVSGSIVNSNLEYFDSLTLNDRVYFEVLEFKLRDHLSIWNTNTVVQFQLAKELGLLSYRLENGNVFMRME